MILSKKFKLCSPLNNGEFGIVYSGENIRNKEKIAIKLEDNTKKSLLKHETIVYQYLKGVDGVPKIKWFGSYNNLQYLVLPLFKVSLTDIVSNNEEIDWVTIGNSLFKTIENIHNRGIIHRDLKPNNIMLGYDNKYYIIDFGFSKSYLDNNNNHNVLKETHSFIGTPNYASLNIHNGYEGSRRDDMISIGYILYYLSEKSLPWENMVDIKDMIELKMGQLNSNEGNMIVDYIISSYQLSFNERPNYNYFIE
jgi:serine/threonine protein kinase